MTERMSTSQYNKLRRGSSQVKTDYKKLFLNQLHLAGLPEPETEKHFALPRRWRADFIWPKQRVICEYNGIFGPRNASHASLQNLRRDYEKITEASLRGYFVILITAESVRDGRAVTWVERALRGRLK